jgi:hypothetical protein
VRGQYSVLVTGSTVTAVTYAVYMLWHCCCQLPTYQLIKALITHASADQSEPVFYRPLTGPRAGRKLRTFFPGFARVKLFLA